jgi:hypothetical protein
MIQFNAWPPVRPYRRDIQSRGRFMESIMSGYDMKYFERRAKEERAMAAAATDRCARQAHERIAAEYEKSRAVLTSRCSGSSRHDRDHTAPGNP